MKNKNQELTSSNMDCQIKIELHAVDHSKVKCIIYIKNKISNNLYFFNRIYTAVTSGGILNVDKNKFYTSIKNDKFLFLEKAIIPPPQNLKVESKIYPGCSKIAPNTVFKEEIEIQLPIKFYAPYVKQNFEETSYPIVFRFGYFVGHSKTESMEIKAASTEGEVILFDPFDYNFQKIIEVGVFDALPIKH